MLGERTRNAKKRLIDSMDEFDGDISELIDDLIEGVTKDVFESDEIQRLYHTVFDNAIEAARRVIVNENSTTEEQETVETAEPLSLGA
jgi:hypothetical protein